MLTSASPRSVDNDSTYDTPNNGDTSPDFDATKAASIEIESTDDNAALLDGAAQSLQTMLEDLLEVLRKQANATVQISGHLSLNIAGTQTYQLSLSTDLEDTENSSVKVQVSRAPKPKSRKRGIEEASEEASEATTSKRVRTASEDAEIITSVNSTEDDDVIQFQPGAHSTEEDDVIEIQPEPVANQVETNAQNPPIDPSITLVLKRLDHISEQVKWIEDCRRVAEKHHTTREENWRSSSATFHDDTRIAREKHEYWLAREMSWHRGMLNNISDRLRNTSGVSQTPNVVTSQIPKWEPPANQHPAPTSARSIFATAHNKTEKRGPGRPRKSAAKQIANPHLAPANSPSSHMLPPQPLSVNYEVPPQAQALMHQNRQEREQHYSLIHVGVKPRDGQVDPARPPKPGRKLQTYMKAYDTTYTPRPSSASVPPAPARFINYGSPLTSEPSKSAPATNNIPKSTASTTTEATKPVHSAKSVEPTKPADTPK